MKNKILTIITLLGFISFLILSGFMMDKNRNRLLTKIYLKNESKEGIDFINEDIVKDIISKKIKLDSVKMKALKIDSIEMWLDQNPFVKNAEVYTTVQGELITDITQKTPVIRVKNGIDEYYLTEENQRIPLSDVYSVNAMLVIGKVDTSDYKPLVDLVKFIHKDKLLKKNITGIQKAAKNSFILKVNQGSFTIDFGKINNFKEKFTKLKLFYNQYLDKMGFNKYKKISLAYKNQVVAQKK